MQHPIRNLKQLCAHAGATSRTLEALEKAVRWEAGCDAWVARVAPGRTRVGSRTVRVRAAGAFISHGFLVREISLNDRKLFALGELAPGDSCARRPGVDRPVPQEVLDRLGAKRCGLAFRTDRLATRAFRVALARGGYGEGFRIRPWGKVLAITFDLEIPRYATNTGGIRIGVPVEGKGGGAIRELLFPFTREEWDAAVWSLKAEGKPARRGRKIAS